MTDETAGERIARQCPHLGIARDGDYGPLVRVPRACAQCVETDRAALLAPIREVYEQFRHLDHLFSDARWMPSDSAPWFALVAMWRAIKAAVGAP